MMKDFLIRNKYILLLGILCAVAAIVFCGHYNNILLDIGREVYYPEQIINGKVLYKDLFNIYGPYSYLFNALLYKIFGAKLGVLYFSGIVSSYLIVFGAFAIAKKFLSEFLSFSIGVFLIVAGVCAPHIFNYTLPYSYGMLYGAVGAIYSILALLKYKEENKTEYLYIASLLGGFCFANKYDFIVYCIFLFVVALMSKNKKVILNFITCFMTIPLICALVLFLQKIGLGDVAHAIGNIKALTAAKSLKYFYTNQGIYFSPKIFIIWLASFARTLIGFGLLVYSVKLFEKFKVFACILFVVSAGILYYFSTPTTFVFIVPLMIILAIVKYKNLKDNPALLYLLISAICLSTKSFWAFLTLNYGNYFAPILLTAFLSILFILLDKKYEKAVAVGLLIVSLHSLIIFSYNRHYLFEKISTAKGTIYTNELQARATNELITGLVDRRAHKVVIYPEGLLINFLADIKSDNYYNSLLPVYEESLGEQKFIDRIKETTPEFVVLNNMDMVEYNKKLVGNDYAIGLKNYLVENYLIVANLGKTLKYIVFRKI